MIFEIKVLIEDYAQQAQTIVERFELKKLPKLLETPLIIEDVIAVNFTKNPVSTKYYAGISSINAPYALIIIYLNIINNFLSFLLIRSSLEWMDTFGPTRSHIFVLPVRLMI